MHARIISVLLTALFAILAAQPLGASELKDRLLKAIPQGMIPQSYKLENSSAAGSWVQLTFKGPGTPFPNGPGYSTGSLILEVKHYPQSTRIRSMKDMVDYELKSTVIFPQNVVSRNVGFGEAGFHEVKKDTNRGKVIVTSQTVVVGCGDYLLRFTLSNHDRTYLGSQGTSDFSDNEAGQLLKRLAKGVCGNLNSVLEEPSDCGKTGQLTRYLKSIREHRTILAGLDQDVETLRRDADLSHAMQVAFGQRLQRRGTEFYRTLLNFKRAETRRGLYEELELISACASHLNQAIGKYQRLVGAETGTATPEEQQAVRNEAMQKVLVLARLNVAARLESEGLRDIVTSESWDEVLDKASFHAGRKVDDFVDREVEKVFGLGFHDARSARRAIQLQMRNEIRRQVAKLLVKITTNEIIIELAAAPIIRWIEGELWPHLREALRNKGNLDARMKRSKETLEKARLILYSLPCTAKLRDVEKAMATARGIIHETHYLMRDLRSANRTADYGRMSDAIANVQRALFITSNRFLLEKPDYEDDLDYVITKVNEMLQELERSVPPQDAALPSDEQSFRLEGSASTEGFEGISGFDARVTGVRFFEGPKALPPVRDHVYRTSFNTQNTRYIYCMMDLRYPALTAPLEFDTTTIWYRPDGSEMNRFTQHARLKKGMTASGHITGWGAKTYGNWKPGDYRVEIVVNGRVVATGSFTVTRGPTG